MKALRELGRDGAQPVLLVSALVTTALLINALFRPRPGLSRHL